MVVHLVANQKKNRSDPDYLLLIFEIQKQQAQKIKLTDLATAGSRLKRTIPKIIR